MDTLDFDLSISKSDNQTYQVAVIYSPMGEPKGVFGLSLEDPVLKQPLQTLQNVRGVSKDTRPQNVQDNGFPLTAVNGQERDVAQQLGRILFEALFPAEVRSVYRASLAEAKNQRKSLRVRLRVDVPYLAMLPWEYLYDEIEGDHVLLGSTSLVRYPELPIPVKPLAVQPPIRILGMIASPKDLAPLNTEQERDSIEMAIDKLIEAGTVQLTWVKGQTRQDLEREMEAGEWHIFHFIGHGSFSPALGEGVIFLADEASGRHSKLSATELGRLVSSRNSLRLAVINACEGARAGEKSLFSSTAAVLARRGVPAVVSMQFVISDKAAIEFSRVFYNSLLVEGHSVDGAVQAARKSMTHALESSTEWGTPVLTMRAQNGTLFHEDYSVIFDPSPIPRAPSPPVPTLRPDTNHAGLERLLLGIRQYWIDGKLNESLFQAIFLDPGLHRGDDDVKSPWGETSWTGWLERPGAESLPLTIQEKIADIFEEEGGSLLILGEPGSGKTISLLRLTQSLLARVEEDPRRPVPVVFNLSSWTAPYTTLEDWLIDELSAFYRVPKRMGRQLLTEGRLLPLLDGLDELEVQRRTDCVQAINRFSQKVGLAGTVVCCRLQEYINLPVRLRLNAAVRLMPLTDDQVQAYLAAAGERLAGLRSLLQRDSALRIDARSPLMLSLMSRTFQDLPVGQLLHEESTSTAMRRKLLVEAYVARMFRRVTQGEHNEAS